jgi:acyl-coenzyme A synthetase/AMP-(fatty) acid ligase
MAPNDIGSLWDWLSAAGHPSDRFLRSAEASASLTELVRGSIFDGRRDLLQGCSVLLATKDQITTGLAAIELDGLARRIVLCPSDLPARHIKFVMAIAAVDAVVSDRAASDLGVAHVECVECIISRNARIVPVEPRERGRHQTEWILLTSGTTGPPKLVVHTLSSLAAPIKTGTVWGNPVVWSTFYDIRRYGGLQIFLRAILGGGSMVLSSADESTGDFLTRAGACGVTHISGTPTHWRRVLMGRLAHRIEPLYLRMSGEIADQAILDRLRTAYPKASIAHAFASTEAGVAFEVGDELCGFPASLIGQQGAEVELKVEDGSLRIRSSRTAKGYLGSEEFRIDSDGFVDTGDKVARRGDRFYFVGRGDGIINVGGRKVHPEEVEAVINRHPKVQMSLVKARKSPITGAVVIADVVLLNPAGTTDDASGGEGEALRGEIINACRRALAAYKVPATVRFVSSLEVTPSGKLART